MFIVHPTKDDPSPVGAACFSSCLRVAQHCSLFNLLPRFLQRLRIDGVERIRCKIPDPAVGVIEQGEQGGNGRARLDVKMSQSLHCSLPNLERGVDPLIEPRLPGGRLILDPFRTGSSPLSAFSTFSALRLTDYRLLVTDYSAPQPHDSASSLSHLLFKTFFCPHFSASFRFSDFPFPIRICSRRASRLSQRVGFRISDFTSPISPTSLTLHKRCRANCAPHWRIWIFSSHRIAE